jgi:hypothetical protein
MSQSTASSTSGLGRWIGIGAAVVFVVIFGAAWSAGSVELYSKSVPVWAVMLASYLLGAVAVWGLNSSKK